MLSTIANSQSKIKICALIKESCVGNLLGKKILKGNVWKVSSYLPI